MLKRKLRFNARARSSQRGERPKESQSGSILIGNSDIGDEVVITEELAHSLRGKNDYSTDGDEILPATKKKKKGGEDDGSGEDAGKSDEEPEPPKRKLSKKELKRLQKVLADKEKKANHAALLESLASQRLSETQTALLAKTSTMSRSKLTKKESLKKQLIAHQGGVAEEIIAPLLEGGSKKQQKRIQLFVPRAKETEVEADTSDEELSDEEEEKSEVSMVDDSSKKKKPEPTPSHSQQPLSNPSTKIPPPPPPSQAALLSNPDTLLAEKTPVDTVPPERLVLCPSSDALKEVVKAKVPAKKAVYIHVDRLPEVQQARSLLPIIGEEQRIMEAISASNVVVLCGSTGSGKTTQVPQFLFEAGYTRKWGPHLIGVTEPRRIAAVSMAARVAHELNLPPGHVAHQVRYDNKVAGTTEIKFMTDGILFKEIEQDFCLRKYSCLIIDEAHERSMNTDVLIGMLSRIVPQREKMARECKDGSIIPLKLIIMSATLRVGDFIENTRLFPQRNVPVISVDARQYPVTVHFSKRTLVDEDIVQCFKKTCQIHEKLPQGGILVFMTGQAEIRDLCHRLKESYPYDSRTHVPDAAFDDVNPHDAIDGILSDSDDSDVSDDDEDDARTGKSEDEVSDTEDLEAKNILYTVEHKRMRDNLKTMKKQERNIERNASKKKLDEKKRMEDDLAKEHSEETEANKDGGKERPARRVPPMYVLPLYANLSAALQSRVFASVPKGTRLCIVATNVAETSLTLPGIRYVVDSGLVKLHVHDISTGVGAYQVQWTSKASADQRAGRAGRTSPGHCYRLFTPAVFHVDFPLFTEPEMLRVPIEGLVLQLKSLHIDNVIQFPYPTPPNYDALVMAEKLLTMLNGIDRDSKKITTVGKAMSLYPIAPRYAKMVTLARHYNCFNFVVAIIAAMTVKDVFTTIQEAREEISENQDGGEVTHQVDSRKIKQQWLLEGLKRGGDMAALLACVGACDYVEAQGKSVEEFCNSHFIRYKAIQEIKNLRTQLSRTNIVFSGLDDEFEEDPIPASSGDADLLPDLAQSTPSSSKPHPALGRSQDKKKKKSIASTKKASEFAAILAPPSDAQVDALRQIILAGFGDQVARISPEAKTIHREDTHFVPYYCEAVKEPVYIHPSSVLAGQRPEFIVYHELSRGISRVYMKGVTVVQREWLPRLVPSLTIFSAPLPQPPPYYNQAKDELRCFMSATYGALHWPIPASDLPFPECEAKYRYFAQFLLEGKIFPEMAALIPRLKLPPSSMNKPWSKDCIVALLRGLMEHRIDSKAKLSSRLKVDPKYLLNALSTWLPASSMSQLVTTWPPKSALSE